MRENGASQLGRYDINALSDQKKALHLLLFSIYSLSTILLNMFVDGDPTNDYFGTAFETGRRVSGGDAHSGPAGEASTQNAEIRETRLKALTCQLQVSMSHPRVGREDCSIIRTRNLRLLHTNRTPCSRGVPYSSITLQLAFVPRCLTAMTSRQ